VLHVAGTGSSALDVAEAAIDAGHAVAGLVELLDPARVGTRVHGLPVVAVDAPPSSGAAVLVAAGGDRRPHVARLAEHGWTFPAVVHPTAHVPRSVVVGAGVFIAPGAVLGSAAVLEDHVFVARGALVGHHTRLGAFARLNPGANVAGNVVVEPDALLAVGCVVRDHVTVGAGAVVAAGAVVVADVAGGRAGPRGTGAGMSADGVARIEQQLLAVQHAPRRARARAARGVGDERAGAPGARAPRRAHRQVGGHESSRSTASSCATSCGASRRTRATSAGACTTPAPTPSTTGPTRTRAAWCRSSSHARPPGRPRGRSVPSVLAQTHPNVEVVVVGDAAGPEVAEALAGIGDPRVRFANLTQRTVASDDPGKHWLVAATIARNEGMRLARGRWTVSLDDDDALRAGRGRPAARPRPGRAGRGRLRPAARPHVGRRRVAMGAFRRRAGGLRLGRGHRPRRAALLRARARRRRVRRARRRVPARADAPRRRPVRDGRPDRLRLLPLARVTGAARSCGAVAVLAAPARDRRRAPPHPRRPYPPAHRQRGPDRDGRPARPRPARSPTAEEIVADARACFAAGATGVHVHARDADGEPEWRRDAYAGFINPAEPREWLPGSVVCATTSGRKESAVERRADVLTLTGDARPDMAS
jgi:acetyltransferase-like isoleucine patch superfamily enzyme